MNKQKVIVASDSFKGSVSSFKVGEYIAEGFRRVSKDIEIENIPIADGGEGTVEALVIGLEGRYIKKDVTGPYGDIVSAKFGLVNDDKTAIIEMAEASGLHLVKDSDDDIFQASSYGTGELIVAALDKGVEEIYIGLGGSATNDGGFGMGIALGAKFLDLEGNILQDGVRNIAKIETINISQLDPRLNNVKVVILSDVTNPLCGSNGATYIYGPQKGVKNEDLPVLDEILHTFAMKMEDLYSFPIIERAGSGSAGGLGAALMAFCQAEMKSGIEEILRLLRFEERIENASLVITGEGKMDGQSLSGKAPIGIANHAKQYGIPVVAIVGSIDSDLKDIYNQGINLVISIVNKPMSLDNAMKHSKTLIVNAGETVYRALYLGGEIHRNCSRFNKVKQKNNK